MKSLPYRILLYIYQNGDEEMKDYVRYVLESERIKRIKVF